MPVFHMPLANAIIGHGSPSEDAAEGSYYIDIDSGSVWIYIDGDWTLVGPVTGEASDGVQVVTTPQSTNLLTYQEITEIPGITPEADAIYQFEYVFFVQTAATNSGVHIAWAHPTGLNDFVYGQWIPSSTYSAEISQWGGPIVSPGVHQAPAANVSYGASGQAAAVVGSSPGVGNIRPRFKTDAPGAIARIMPGSAFWWERVA